MRDILDAIPDCVLKVNPEKQRLLYSNATYNFLVTNFIQKPEDKGESIECSLNKHYFHIVAKIFDDS